MNNITYKIVMPGVVEIQNEMNEPFRLNENAAIQAIQNIKKQRQCYVTETAYQRQLGKYEGVLTYLQSNA